MLNEFREINWNFDSEKTNYATHEYHPYPAKFIPQIPNNLIKLFSKKDDVVYDPFCGSGTTVVESVINGRNAIGNDVNPLAVLISKVKSTYLPEKRVSRIKQILFDIEVLIDSFYDNPALFCSRNSENTHVIDSPNLEYWFHRDVIKELGIIKRKLLDEKDNDIKDFLNIAFSGIIVSVSFQDSNTRYVKVEKNIKQKDTFSRFKAAVLRMIKKNHELSPFKNSRPIIKIADTRQNTGFKEDTADIAITSPPYPNAYDYHLYHKHRMYWLEMDPLELKHKEIGAHANYSKENGFTDIDFAEDMRRSFVEISRILKDNAYFFIVIGDSIIKGKKIKNNELLKDISKKTSLHFQCEIKRNIKLSRKSFNPKIGNIKTEHIMAFKNEK